jgi:hypothetical protein
VHTPIEPLGQLRPRCGQADDAGVPPVHRFFRKHAGHGRSGEFGHLESTHDSTPVMRSDSGRYLSVELGEASIEHARPHRGQFVLEP